MVILMKNKDIDAIRSASGYPDDKTGNLLYSVANMRQPKNVLEIGFNLGYSAIYLARVSGRVVSLDNDASGNVSTGLENVKGQGIENHKVMVGNSEDLVSRVVEEFDGLIDLLFIDGDHSYEGCKADWDNYSPLLAKNAVVLFHDSVRAKGVKRVINEIERSGWRRYTFPVRGGKRVAGMDLVLRKGHPFKRDFILSNCSMSLM